MFKILSKKDYEGINQLVIDILQESKNLNDLLEEKDKIIIEKNNIIDGLKEEIIKINEKYKGMNEKLPFLKGIINPQTLEDISSEGFEILLGSIGNIQLKIVQDATRTGLNETDIAYRAGGIDILREIINTLNKVNSIRKTTNNLKQK